MEKINLELLKKDGWESTGIKYADGVIYKNGTKRMLIEEKTNILIIKWDNNVKTTLITMSERVPS